MTIADVERRDSATERDFCQYIGRRFESGVNGERLRELRAAYFAGVHNMAIRCDIKMDEGIRSARRFVQTVALETRREVQVIDRGRKDGSDVVR